MLCYFAPSFEWHQKWQDELKSSWIPKVQKCFRYFQNCSWFILLEKKKLFSVINSINENLQTIYKSLMKDCKMELILNLENIYIKRKKQNSTSTERSYISVHYTLDILGSDTSLHSFQIHQWVGLAAEEQFEIKRILFTKYFTEWRRKW